MFISFSFPSAKAGVQIFALNVARAGNFGIWKTKQVQNPRYVKKSQSRKRNTFFQHLKGFALKIEGKNYDIGRFPAILL